VNHGSNNDSNTPWKIYVYNIFIFFLKRKKDPLQQTEEEQRTSINEEEDRGNFFIKL
jgi:hypothetical protein